MSEMLIPPETHTHPIQNPLPEPTAAALCADEAHVDRLSDVLSGLLLEDAGSGRMLSAVWVEPCAKITSEDARLP